jgi:N-acetylmuramoyl-L-alanine amidase
VARLHDAELELDRHRDRERASGDHPEGASFPDYPKAQIDAVVALVKAIVARHGIRPENIVAHGDIAPQRKMDPGPPVPWKRLADEGLIKWPDAAEVAKRQAAFEKQLPDTEWFQRTLAKHGYAVPVDGELDRKTQRVIMVFQMRYRPAKHDGMPDAETAAILDVLVNP